MKIVFIGGSMEPGCDGVGDYTRRLAGELIRQGHEVTAIALNDHYVKTSWKCMQNDGQEKIPILRLPACLSWKERIEEAKKWIYIFNPEWLSLQYVPFAFHPKGLSFRLSGHLQELSRGRYLHIMFHELWVGMDVNSSKKLIWWGRLQQQLIKNMVLKLKPNIIHTHTRLYQALLGKLGFVAGHLPLFGNIPFVNEDDDVIFDKRAAPLKSKKRIRLVSFGAIHPGAPIEQFVTEVASYSRQFDVPVSLTIIGRCGTEQIRWIKVWKSAGLFLQVFGEQSAECISKILSTASLGVSTTPIALSEKSGTIAAMREHGLPVLCVSLPWQERHLIAFNPPSGIFEYKNGRSKELLAIEQKLPYSSQIAQIAMQLIQSLQIEIGEKYSSKKN